MFKPPPGYTMATKASSTLLLIIEKQHASWDLMVIASHVVERRFCHRLRIASARPLVGPKCPRTRVVGGMCLEVTNGLPVACTSFSGPLRCATQQLDACFRGLRAGQLNSVPQWRSVPESSMSEHSNGRNFSGLRGKNGTYSSHN